ncbi:MAG TPA: TonB family protein [Pyrinomonadaceae bacterium]|nr:TonB family protein [Pyrinomonadaceae bacterium]
MIKQHLVICSALFMLAAAGTGASQSPSPTPSPSPTECEIPVIRPVDTRAKISAKPDPQFTKRDRERYHRQEIILRATLCGSGKVTDIKVRQGLTAEMDAAAIEAARLIQFTPAEKDGKKASSAVILRYIVKD